MPRTETFADEADAKVAKKKTREAQTDAATTNGRVERHVLNLTTADLEIRARIAESKREVRDIARRLLDEPTSKQTTRHEFGRRLNGVAAQLTTVEMRLLDPTESS